MLIFFVLCYGFCLVFLGCMFFGMVCMGCDEGKGSCMRRFFVVNDGFYFLYYDFWVDCVCFEGGEGGYRDRFLGWKFGGGDVLM